MRRTLTDRRIFACHDGLTEAHVDYEFTPGEEPSGQFGPPEDYDPGCGEEIWIGRVIVYGSDALGDDYAIRVEMTQADRAAFEAEVAFDPPEPPSPPEDDKPWRRDE